MRARIWINVWHGGSIEFWVEDEFELGERVAISEVAALYSALQKVSQ